MWGESYSHSLARQTLPAQTQRQQQPPLARPTRLPSPPEHVPTPQRHSHCHSHCHSPLTAHHSPSSPLTRMLPPPRQVVINEPAQELRLRSRMLNSRFLLVGEHYYIIEAVGPRFTRFTQGTCDWLFAHVPACQWGWIGRWGGVGGGGAR